MKTKYFQMCWSSFEEVSSRNGKRRHVNSDRYICCSSAFCIQHVIMIAILSERITGSKSGGTSSNVQTPHSPGLLACTTNVFSLSPLGIELCSVISLIDFLFQLKCNILLCRFICWISQTSLSRAVSCSFLSRPA